MSCICSSNIVVLVYGTCTDFFSPSRGIRQGDPMSPYIFILCMELLSSYISYQIDIFSWKPVTLSKNGLHLSHLFFIDDLTHISQADDISIHTIHKCMNIFPASLAKKLTWWNLKLSSQNIVMKILNSWSNGVSTSSSVHFGKYLGFSILNNKSKPGNFQYIIDNMKKKLSSWKINFLTPAGRLVLAQSTLNAIPAYSMQYFCLQKNMIDKIQRDILWGSTNHKKKNHYVAWKIVASPKEYGGLGSSQLI